LRSAGTSDAAMQGRKGEQMPSSPLIERLTGTFGYPRLESLDAFDDFIGSPGVHLVFVPGDPARNLESDDVAVILPEIVAAFEGRFDVAVAGDAIERSVRERVESFQTPNLIFWCAGRLLGDIPKVRDWDDYMARVQAILASSGQAVA